MSINKHDQLKRVGKSNHIVDTFIEKRMQPKPRQQLATCGLSISTQWRLSPKPWGRYLSSNAEHKKIYLRVT